MMYSWTKLLPLFVVQYLAKKYSERWIQTEAGKDFAKIYTEPYDGVRFYFTDEGLENDTRRKT